MATIPPCFRVSHRPGLAVATLLMASVALSVGGCADEAEPAKPAVAAAPGPDAAAQLQAKEFHGIIAELRRASECVTATEDKPEFALLRAKAPPGGGKDPYPGFFLDKTRATPAEQKLIGTFLDQIAPCQPNFGTLSVREHRSITRMIADTWMQQSELYRHLKEGGITWGVFNQGTRSNSDKLSGGLQALRLTNEG